MGNITMNLKERKQLIVFERILNGEITQQTASEILHVTARWIRNKIKRYIDYGAKGIVHRSRGKESSKKWNKKEKDFALKIFENEWSDFSVTFFAEKLEEIYDIKVNRETLRQELIRNNLWNKRHRKKKHMLWRKRKEARGIMVQLDGSPHDWLEGRDGPPCTLLVFIDDATSELLWLEFASGETVSALMNAERNYINKHGQPVSFYVDYGSVFSVNLNNHDRRKITQFERANKELGINIIHANSPQAKGRVERSNKTLQDRLIKEMRLRNISSIEEANDFAQNEYISIHNKRFSVPPASTVDEHLPVDSELNLDNIFCIKEERILTNDNTISYKRRLIQLDCYQQAIIRPKDKIQVYEHLNGKLSLWIRKKPLNFSEIGTRVKNKLSPVEYVGLERDIMPKFEIMESRVKTALPAVEANV